jgi:L-rhamnose mutarotase
MRTQYQRAVWVAAPVLIGVLLGWLLSEARHDSQAKALAQETPHQQAVEAPSPHHPPAAEQKPVKRVGSVVGVNRETLDQYVILHKYVWPEVLNRIRESGIRNYSIYLGELDDGKLYLFSYFEYVGDNFDEDMKSIGNDPVTREWWKLTDPLQNRIKNTPTGDQWKAMTEVFHTD